MKKIFVLFCMSVGLIGLTACTKSETKITKEIMAMDTYMTITCYGVEAKEATELALYEIERLDKLWSVGNPESEVNRLNTGTDMNLSEDSIKVIEKSRYIYDTTDGAFDITIRPLMQLWGFEKGVLNIPSENEVKETLNLCDFKKLSVDIDVLNIEKGMGIDFGGIAKGYTSSRLMDIFGEFNIKYAIVSLGGNIQCYGKKPDGSAFNIAITNPDPSDNNGILGSLKVGEKAVITSGGYERYFTDENTGKKYCHIIDPRTGYPAESDIQSVTIISTDGMLADGLSTACYVMGLEKSADYWREHKSEFDFVILAEDGIVYVTAGISDYFETGYEVKIIE